MSTALRGVALSMLLLAGGTLGLYEATDGFRAFTAQSARAVEVAAAPRPVPDARLEDQASDEWAFDKLAGKWLVVDFMYTRCTTLCLAMGSKFGQLETELAAPIAAGKVRLLSISFDPEHDTPAQLADYLKRFGWQGSGWSAVRPRGDGQMAALKRTFGITVIPDGMGGYMHNDGFGIVDPAGRLVDIADEDSSAGAVAGLVERYLRGQPS